MKFCIHIFILWIMVLVDVPANSETLEPIKINAGGTGFEFASSGKPFRPWGFNYDHDRQGRLLEDYWIEEWKTVEEDFIEMKALGANVVRIHLQLGQFMDSPLQPNQANLEKLQELPQLAKKTGLYLNITGLGCYHQKDVPDWYDVLPEKERWEVQSRFWSHIAETCADEDAVFCYDLMNEPILPGNKNVETEWLAGEFGGKHFVQRIALDLKGRTRDEVVRAWVTILVSAIREQDKDHLITVGVIPWALTWPNAKPVFYSENTRELLDFVSVHFYPQRGEIDKALEALSTFEMGKPLVIEEMFPLRCDLEELNLFIEKSSLVADGWFGFYWGETIDELGTQPSSITRNITQSWFKYFKENKRY